MTGNIVPIKVDFLDLLDNWTEILVDRLRNDPDGEWAQVIRCKRCKHFEQDIMNPNVGVCCHDGWVDRQYSIGFEVNEDGFCYRAELKEEVEA